MARQRDRLYTAVRAVLWVYGIGLAAMLVWVILAALSPAHAQVPPEAHRYRLTLVREAQRAWGLDAPVAALAAQVHQESGWQSALLMPSRAHHQVAVAGINCAIPRAPTRLTASGRQPLS